MGRALTFKMTMFVIVGKDSMEKVANWVILLFLRLHRVAQIKIHPR